VEPIANDTTALETTLTAAYATLSARFATMEAGITMDMQKP
jgi:hypothetical protein